jgi:hypothetical protein
MCPHHNDMPGISRRALLAGGIASLIVVPAIPVSALAEETTAGRIETVRGEAAAEALTVRRPLSAGAEIFAGDTVVTAAQSHVRMSLGAAIVANLGAEALLRIDRFAAGAGGTLNLAAGAVLIDRTDPHGREVTQLRSPFGLLVARGARFFAGPSYGAFGIFVFRGEVTVTAAGQTVVLRADQGTEFRKAGQYPSPPRRWSRDRVAAALASAS